MTWIKAFPSRRRDHQAWPFTRDACELAPRPHFIRMSTQSTHEQITALVDRFRSEEHTSELQSLMRISYAVFCLKKKKNKSNTTEQLARNQTEINIIITH